LSPGRHYEDMGVARGCIPLLGLPGAVPLWVSRGCSLVGLPGAVPLWVCPGCSPVGLPGAVPLWVCPGLFPCVDAPGDHWSVPLRKLRRSFSPGSAGGLVT
jgi:hypothetical protein